MGSGQFAVTVLHPPQPMKEVQWAAGDGIPLTLCCGDIVGPCEFNLIERPPAFVAFSYQRGLPPEGAATMTRVSQTPLALTRLLGLARTAAAARITNGGFESRNLSGWQTTGDGSVVGSSIGSFPTQGCFRAILTTASQSGGTPPPDFTTPLACIESASCRLHSARPPSCRPGDFHTQIAISRIKPRPAPDLLLVFDTRSPT